MKRIPLNRGQVALVDDADYVWLFKHHWWLQEHKSGLKYAQTAIVKRGKPRLITMHRLIVGAKRGEEVDHRDLNGLNNQRHNLRRATRHQQRANEGLKKNNTTGFKGICFIARYHCWHALICVNYRNKFLGYFKTPEEAARAYDVAAVKYFGEFARTNLMIRGPY